MSGLDAVKYSKDPIMALYCELSTLLDSLSSPRLVGCIGCWTSDLNNLRGGEKQHEG